MLIDCMLSESRRGARLGTGSHVAALAHAHCFESFVSICEYLLIRENGDTSLGAGQAPLSSAGRNLDAESGVANRIGLKRRRRWTLRVIGLRVQLFVTYICKSRAVIEL